MPFFRGIHLPSPYITPLKNQPWGVTNIPGHRHANGIQKMTSVKHTQFANGQDNIQDLLSSLRQMFFPPDKYCFFKPPYGGGSFHPISISVYTLVISSRKKHIIASKIETYRNQIIVESDKQIAPFVSIC